MSTDTIIVPAHLAKTWDGTDESIFDWWDKLRALDDALYEAGKSNLLAASYVATDLVPPHRSLLPTNPMGKEGPDFKSLSDARHGFTLMGMAGARPQELADWSGWTVMEVMQVMFTQQDPDELQKFLDAIEFVDANPNTYKMIEIRDKFELTRSGIKTLVRSFNIPLKPNHHPQWVGDAIRAKRKECPRMGATLLAEWFNENHTSPAGKVGRSAAGKMITPRHG